MSKRLLFPIVLCAVLFGCTTKKPSVDYLQYVDPYIGTDAHGHVFLGASVPHGMVQVGLSNINKGWDWCSGYHYSDSICIGFTHLHLNGTGATDLNEILLMPFTGEIKTEKGSQDNPDSGYASRYGHKQETARPNYYSVQLTDYNIRAELTAGERAAIHRYTFPDEGPKHLIIDLGEGYDKVLMSHMKIRDNQTITGWRYSTGWARDHKVYFAVQFEKPIDGFQLYNDSLKTMGDSLTIKKVKGVVTFPADAKTVLLKVGISFVSMNNALANISSSVPGWDFERIEEAGNQQWNGELSRVKIETADSVYKRVFYTALYHTMITPALFDDFDGSYLGADLKTHPNPGYDTYTIFSLWDTYRAFHPLMTIIEPEKVSDYINSILSIYQQQGKLPIWHLDGNETDCLIGYSAVPVIADAILKGFQGFDYNLAFEAMLASSSRDDQGVEYMKSLGYIPSDKEGSSVSKALEYAIDDWGIAQVAEKLNRSDEYKRYSDRAKYYQKYFDKKTHFMRGVTSDGHFREPFDPFKSNYSPNDYTEGNAWQYTFLVPQDVEGVIKCFGGPEKYTEKLDSLFRVDGSLGENAAVDVSGLIGMYAHGNEPSHHVAYLYPFAGQQWKTAEKVRQIIHDFYTDQPDGLCGNEDCGQMSAWAVFSMLGFYPVNPANGLYVLGSPCFDEATIDVGNGKAFVVHTINNSAENKYIQRVELNGTEYPFSYIRHTDIVRGGKLVVEMGSQPNKTFAANPDYWPSSGLLSDKLGETKK